MGYLETVIGEGDVAIFPVICVLKLFPKGFHTLSHMGTRYCLPNLSCLGLLGSQKRIVFFETIRGNTVVGYLETVIGEGNVATFPVIYDCSLFSGLGFALVTC